MLTLRGPYRPPIVGPRSGTVVGEPTALGIGFVYATGVAAGAVAGAAAWIGSKAIGSFPLVGSVLGGMAAGAASVATITYLGR